VGELKCSKTRQKSLFAFRKATELGLLEHL